MFKFDFIFLQFTNSMVLSYFITLKQLTIKLFTIEVVMASFTIKVVHKLFVIKVKIINFMGSYL